MKPEAPQNSCFKALKLRLKYLKHCLKGDKLGKVNDLYFLSFRPKNGIENYNFSEVALHHTNLLFPPIKRKKHLLAEI